MSFVTDTSVEPWVTRDDERQCFLMEIAQSRQGVADFEFEVGGQVVCFKAIHLRLIEECMFEISYQILRVDIPSAGTMGRGEVLGLIRKALECHGFAGSPDMTRSVKVIIPPELAE